MKSGANKGQPRVDYYFALAIPKTGEQHWSQTSWGQLIYAIGVAGFPNGQTQAPTFAWKVTDGDSTIPNKAGKKNCDLEGYQGCWILNFSSAFAPSIYAENGHKQILEKDFIKPGDYIEVYGSVSDNESQQQPGVYLNHEMINFAAYGDRIVLGADPKAVGFGQSPLPAGASATPKPTGFNPVDTSAPSAPVFPIPTAPHSAPVATPVPPPPPPYPGILNPVIARPKVMTPAAGGATYESFIAMGWTDDALIANGLMQP